MSDARCPHCGGALRLAAAPAGGGGVSSLRRLLEQEGIPAWRPGRFCSAREIRAELLARVERCDIANVPSSYWMPPLLDALAAAAPEFLTRYDGDGYLSPPAYVFHTETRGD